jgi:WXG100 family type VII secretion target
MTRYKVDLVELDSTIKDMERFERILSRHVADLDSLINKLHGVWHGVSATAQKNAHDEWARGARELHAALVTMREAAVIAHQNYHGAGDANARMMRQVR